MFFKKKAAVNFLSLVPVHNVAEFTDDGNIVVLHIPRFKWEMFRKWFVPKQKSPFYNIKLDETGSATWRLIDGKRTVDEICRSLVTILEEKNKPSSQLEERVTVFLSGLIRNRLVKINEVSTR